jgi:Domain of unknown function (DUF4335)
LLNLPFVSFSMPVIARRYTPPTCTLEITAQTSALSRWTRQPVLKSLDFLLSFKELRDRNEQPIEVQGNRDQLDSLSEAVSQYVEQILGQSLMELPIASNASSEALESPLETIDALLSDATDGLGPVAKGPESLPMEAPLALPVPVHLRPKNLLTHELVLGALATETSGPIVQLKASQLFDLASALDEYAAEVETLPTQVPVPSRAVPVWTRAAGLILLVGGTTFAITQVFNAGLDPTLTVSQEEQSSQPAPQASSSLPPIATTPFPRPSPTQPLPQVNLPRRDAADSISGDRSAPLSRTQSSSGDRTQAGSSTSRGEGTNLPPLPAPPPPIEWNSNDLRPSEQLDAPTIIAGGTPRELGKTNLESSASESVDQFSGATSSRANSEQQVQASSPPPALPSVAQEPARFSNPSNTALDATPQTTQARQYLAPRWQAPPNLKQTLQYTLVLNPNGSIRQIKPRGQAASQYLGRTPIPGVNQPFVSPSRAKNTAIRVVLGTDGSVQTFLESSP